MTINERISVIEAELNAAREQYNAARAAYEAYDLDPTHFKDDDRSARLEELFQAIGEKAANTREIGSRLNELKRERLANSKQGQLYENLFKSLRK